MIRTALFFVILSFTWQYSAAKSNKCTNNPCKNKGLCIVVNGTMQCKCKNGWGGSLCEVGLNGNSELCTKRYIVKVNDTCKSIIKAHRMQKKRFVLLNPNADCSNNLEIGSSICLNNGGDGCTLFHDIKPNEKNCTVLADSLGLNINTFKALNPQINCSKEITLETVCVDGTSPECLSEYTIAEGDNIDKILKNRSISSRDFHEANPFIAEEQITVGQVVCLVAKKRRSHIDKLHKVLNKLGESHPNLKQKYAKYRNDPRESNRNEIETEIKSLMTKPEFRKSLKKLEESDETLIYLSKARKIDRNEICNNLKDKPMYKNSSDCFCGNSEPVIYCLHVYHGEMAPLVREYQNELKRNDNSANYNLTRVKRVGCSLEGSFLTGEITAECCIIAGLEFCLNIHGGYDPKARGTEEFMFGIHVGGTFSACIPFIKKIVEKLNLDSRYVCLAEATIDYHPFKNNLKIVGTLHLLFTLEVGGVYQIGNAPDWLCETDYCQKPQCYVLPKTFYFTGLELILDVYFYSFTLYSYGDQTPKCNPTGLQQNVPLKRNKPLLSGNGYYEAVLEDNGNFVFYDKTNGTKIAKFATGTISNSDPAANYLVVGSDGNVILYDQNNKKWESGSVNGEAPYKLVLQNDGKLVLFDGLKRAIWIVV